MCDSVTVTVWQCYSVTMTVWHCDCVTVWQYDIVTVTLWQYDSVTAWQCMTVMTVWQYDIVTVWHCHSVTVYDRYDSVAVWQCHIMTLWQCESMILSQCDIVTVPCDSMTVWQHDSVSVYVVSWVKCHSVMNCRPCWTHRVNNSINCSAAPSLNCSLALLTRYPLSTHVYFKPYNAYMWITAIGPSTAVICLLVIDVKFCYRSSSYTLYIKPRTRSVDWRSRLMNCWAFNIFTWLH